MQIGKFTVDLCFLEMSICAAQESSCELAKLGQSFNLHNLDNLASLQNLNFDLQNLGRLNTADCIHVTLTA